MIIGKDKLQQLDGEKPRIGDRQHRRMFQSKYQYQIIKGVVEIIKNGADAYLNEVGESKCNKEVIKIVLDSLKRKNNFIKITNFAPGMNSEMFEKALEVGADTSGKFGAGAHGYGMKEASWAFDTARIISVRNGKYSSRIFYWDENKIPGYAWDKDDNGEKIKDFPLDQKTISKTGIKSEGTYFEGVIPEEIPCPSPDTLKDQLSNNILLRTINQSNKFNIYIEYKETNNPDKLSSPIKYSPPEIFSLREDMKAQEVGEFSFNYPDYGIVNCKFEIFLAKHELQPNGPTREAGLLVCADIYSVLDCTLFDLGDKIAYRFFGNILLSGPIREISKKERIIDDRREAGLLKDSPLYKILYKKFNKLLEGLIDKERKRLNRKKEGVSTSIIDNQIELIKEFNKIDRKENEPTQDIVDDEKFVPGSNGIRFCVSDYLRLIENQEKKIHIVADPSIIGVGTEIEIKPDKSGIDVTPKKFKIIKNDINEKNIFKKKISFFSSKIDSFLVTAYVTGMLNKTELNIEVERDPRLHIKKAIEFVPNEQDIVCRKQKKVPLIIDYNKIDKKDKITINCDAIFAVNKPISLKDSQQIFENIYELLIPIHCSGRPKQKGQFQVKIGNESATLNLKVIDSRDRHLKGDFEGIKDDKTEDPDDLSYFEDKIINVCVNHPILRYYRRNKDGENNIAYRTLYGDIVIREFCMELTRKKIKTFTNVTSEEYRVRFDRKYQKYYKEHSTRLHKLCINPKYLEKLKI
tara:strand:- start:2123 stop:4366 length:2244 start_codon:yes stop_codon:yes gene_type:complete